MDTYLYPPALERQFFLKNHAGIDLVTSPASPTNFASPGATLQFLEEAKLRISLMKEAFAFNDWETLGALSHNLQNELNRYGYQELAALAKSIALYSGSCSNLSHIPAYLNSLEQYIAFAWQKSLAKRSSTFQDRN